MPASAVTRTTRPPPRTTRTSSPTAASLPATPQVRPAAAVGRRRGPVNKFTQTVSMVLADAQRQGICRRNVAEHVDPVAVGHRSVDTYTEAEV